MQDELLDVYAACALIGGTKPINAATLYRGIATEPFTHGPSRSASRRCAGAEVSL